MSETPKIDGRQVKILLVDDEEIVLSLARDALEDGGYEISTAGGYNEAVSILKREYFDFILTDIRMPEGDGIQLAQTARQIIPSIGVMFMTGYANLTSAKDAIKEGAYDYILKPFELNEIRLAVQNAVRKKQKDTEKTLNTELTKLSELNELMYTIGDRQSLMRLSLGFAMMQSKVKKGAVAFRTQNSNEIGIISTINLHTGEFLQSAMSYQKDYFGTVSPELETPTIVTTLEENPLFKMYGDEQMSKFLIPDWYIPGDHMVNISLKRGSKLYGILILGYAEDSDTLKASNLKFLDITANQIAISLENISLLEESRNAYSRLKDLQDQTIQLEKMATKGEMSAEIGHELNNFLGVVAGNISLMEHHLLKGNHGELQKYLNAMKTNLEQMRKFTSGLMDFSGLEASFENCDINSLINDFLEYLRAQKRLQKVEMNFEVSADNIIARADPSQLQQLLYNLVNNAADACIDSSEEKSRQVTVKTEYAQDDSSFSLTVSDNGTGFDPDYIDRAFTDRFTTKESGHGFGLLVCRRIIDNHKGKLQIDSKPGVGSSINIRFPVRAHVKEAAVIQ